MMQAAFGSYDVFRCYLWLYGSCWSANDHIESSTEPHFAGTSKMEEKGVKLRDLIVSRAFEALFITMPVHLEC